MPPKRNYTLAPVCGNPLYQQWINEWVEKAKAENSKAYHTYKRAFDSLSKYPLPFNHPIEALILNGIGPAICKKLEKRLMQHCKETGEPMPKHPDDIPKTTSKINELEMNKTTESLEVRDPVSKKQKRIYLPQYKSGGYGIILALYLNYTKYLSSNHSMTKADLIKVAQQFCESSFDMPSSKQGKYYTAWNSMRILLDKDYVYKNGCPPRYSLTDAGLLIARQMIKTSKKSGVDVFAGLGAGEDPLSMNFDQISSLAEKVQYSGYTIFDNVSSNLDQSASTSGSVFSENKPITELEKNSDDNSQNIPIVGVRSESSSSSSSFENLTSKPTSDYPSFTPIKWLPGTFEVALLVDNREMRKKQDRDYFEQQLLERGINAQVRALELGDVIWVARRYSSGSSGKQPEEIVLDFVMERKRMDDLIMSIKDGRFKEQKFRLKKSGTKQIIYLVEDYLIEEAVEFGMQAVQTAMSETQVINGFFLKRTKTIDQTIDYLVAMTKILKSLHENKILYEIPNNVVFRSTFLELKQRLSTSHLERSYHISYAMYSEINSKNGSLTLRDTFVKMLMTVRGISGDKALEIAKRYSTPHALNQAYESLSTEEEKKKMLKETCNKVIGRKKIGPALSEKVAHIWCANSYE
ncbi:hypothetical protein G9A89_022567 [Geosiphon pyriformis]|nr:hypothetical protein G9A89_022567 [Geosiphon pyriformis]